MLEAELHLIKSRLTAGLKHKAAKGELRQGLPVGLDYEDDRAVMTPDEAVREAIVTVYRRFEELGSARQVLIRLREDGVLLPRRANGSRRITWARQPTRRRTTADQPRLRRAFVFGRTRTEKRVDPITGTGRSRVQLLPREQWEVLIPDDHPGYISWETYEVTRHGDAAIGADPANWPAARGAKAARVAGLAALRPLRRIMQTGYSGTTGTPALCVCPRQAARRRRARLSKHRRDPVGEQGPRRDVRRAGPAALTATAQALAEADANYRRDLAVFELAVERVRHEADRALRQFDNVEPENRLVERTLEKTLEAKLAAVRAAENDLAAQRARRPVA